MSYEDWKGAMRMNIAAASIAKLVLEHEGQNPALGIREFPNDEEMELIVETAWFVADAWEKTVT